MGGGTRRSGVDGRSHLLTFQTRGVRVQPCRFGRVVSFPRLPVETLCHFLGVRAISNVPAVDFLILSFQSRPKCGSIARTTPSAGIVLFAARVHSSYNESAFVFSDQRKFDLSESELVAPTRQRSFSKAWCE